MQMIGRLADQPEDTPTSTGTALTKFALGVSTGRKDENGNRGVSWFKVASFADGGQRELLLSLPKGTQMFVEAEASMNKYEVDGQARTALNLVARNFEVLSPRRQENAETSGAESDTNAVEEPLSGIGPS
ncbi:ssDNA-binding protein, mitochondrial [Extremus antarcticus]|uniref:Single-stranded DNA-binding protein n=1 Tax=Extremus antarcticus TaxID=702011 RepID=A0AAJ0DHE2_9PEZI|nr:ssDNA-binding protein, mitochondrial [Extremus antarcticus]